MRRSLHRPRPAPPRRAPSNGRLRAARIVASIMAVSAIGFGLFTAAIGVLSPAQASHAFHNAVVAALLLVPSAPPVIAVARAPQRAIRPLVILAFVGVAALATMALSLTLDPFTLPFVVLVGILWALLPSRAGAYPAGRPSWILLALAAVAAATLVPYALAQAELQRADQTSEHAMFYHWLEMSFYAMAIPLLGLLSALRPREYRMAAWCGGVALAVMAAASLALGEYASALPTPWAWAALAGSALFVGLTEWEARRSRQSHGRAVGDRPLPARSSRANP